MGFQMAFLWIFRDWAFWSKNDGLVLLPTLANGIGVKQCNSSKWLLKIFSAVCFYFSSLDLKMQVIRLSTDCSVPSLSCCLSSARLADETDRLILDQFNTTSGFNPPATIWAFLSSSIATAITHVLMDGMQAGNVHRSLGGERRVRLVCCWHHPSSITPRAFWIAMNVTWVNPAGSNSIPFW